MPQFFPAAPALTETETVEILASGLKKRIYPDAVAVSETESMTTALGLKWFLSKEWLGEVETESNGKVAAIVKHFPVGLTKTETETVCSNLAIWPEPPTPTAVISCAGKDLHRQSLRQGNSHQISLAINFTETTVAAVGLLQVVFKINQPGTETVILAKTRFGAPGGIITDLTQDLGDGRILLLTALQLRPNQIIFSGSESEFDFVVIVENSTISQRANVASGTIILTKG